MKTCFDSMNAVESNPKNLIADHDFYLQIIDFQIWFFTCCRLLGIDVAIWHTPKIRRAKLIYILTIRNTFLKQPNDQRYNIKKEISILIRMSLDAQVWMFQYLIPANIQKECGLKDIGENLCESRIWSTLLTNIVKHA